MKNGLWDNNGLWDYREYCDAVETEATQFAQVVQDVDMSLPVPTCPQWCLADLIEHHGRSQRRVEYVVRHRSQQPVWAKDVAIGLPETPAEYPEWFASGISGLVATLLAADPDTPMWTNGADQRLRYWARRVLFEAVVHRADAELALGRTPHLDTRTAADGIGEMLANMPCFPWIAERQRTLNRPGEALHFSAADQGAWLVTLTEDGFTWSTDHAQAAVSVSGSAGDLLMLIYGRFSPDDDRLSVRGDLELLRRWLDSCAL